jgi:MurNAc alpha-1-phosphate uridylyltransferase
MRACTVTIPCRAMVLAAGLGARMRPLTDVTPKPLVRIGGRALIDHVLDRLAAAGTDTAVVNVHYRADDIERHLATRRTPNIVISDERTELLDTGGAVAKALPLLGAAPFFHLNSDTIWSEGVTPNLIRLAEAFDGARMDALLLLAAATSSIGYAGRGDFTMAGDGKLQRRLERDVAPFIFAGAAILSPALFADAPGGAFSLNLLFDRAIAAGRLYGMRLDGVWMHVGTAEAVLAAEAAIAEAASPFPANGGRAEREPRAGSGKGTTRADHATPDGNCETLAESSARLS